MKTPHIYEFVVRESHLDTFGHVNHAVYLTLFEEARWQLITERGYGLKKILECRQAPVILGASVEYKRELTLRQTIRIETHLGEYSRRIAQICQKMVNLDGKLIASAEFKFALFDLDTRKILTPTPAWHYAIGATENLPQE